MAARRRKRSYWTVSASSTGTVISIHGSSLRAHIMPSLPSIIDAAFSLSIMVTLPEITTMFLSSHTSGQGSLCKSIQPFLRFELFPANTSPTESLCHNWHMIRRYWPSLKRTFHLHGNRLNTRSVHCANLSKKGFIVMSLFCSLMRWIILANIPRIYNGSRIILGLDFGKNLWLNTTNGSLSLLPLLKNNQ